ncbi:hypothetical protein HMJ29_00560 [Hymenobacter taeanensis]|uniref:DUF3575 domain-containing protein n=1 Tax=Hymenobacter taeanensis TaxID=2735321 RepID=A0A6M6BBY1_9BACT|nr:MULTISPECIES: hypothetical protein [Hymenobacter]QJX45509.1 hypothetical protein HMJ29_00560 [Hymenobacter taeanensis]UOQ81244.1 hypothetical protein MUN83_00120 [Hymenobacter sp. 5414T-23]
MKISALTYVPCSSLLLLLGASRVAYSNAALPPDSTFVRQAHRRAVFQFDQRFSILNGKVVGINGVKGGIEWRGRWRAGVGVYRLSGGVPTRAAQPEGTPPGTHDEVRFRYLAAYGEYVFIGNQRWELSTPLQLGAGSYYTKYYFPDGGVRRTSKEVIYMLEPSVAAHYRIFRWVGVGAGGGYRQALAAGEAPEDDMSGIIFFGRVKLFLGDFVKVVRGHERLFTQQGLKPTN